MEYIKQYEPLWGNWYIEEKLGKGGFGSVYKACRNTMLIKEYAAVKMIRRRMEPHEVQLLRRGGLSPAEISRSLDREIRRYKNEISAMLKLKGITEIVSIEDYAIYKTEKGYDILIRMELLETLDEKMLEHTFSREEVIRLGIDICSALEYCQKKNIIHKDLKPSNIFINSFGRYKLGDFGLAKNIQESLTMSRSGTTAYMAPEVFRMEKASFDSDIYCLGLTMYELLNHNRLPFLPAYPEFFDYEDQETAISRRLNGEPVPPFHQGSEQNLWNIIKKACSYDRRDRYHTAAELKQDLSRLILSDGFSASLNKDSKSHQKDRKKTKQQKDFRKDNSVRVRVPAAIDFGSEYTRLAVFTPHGTPEMVPSAAAVPSLIGLDRKGNWVIGKDAQMLQSQDPDRVCPVMDLFFPVRKICTLAGKDYSAQELISSYFRLFIEYTRDFSNWDCILKVIAVPSDFGYRERELLLECMGQIFPEERIRLIRHPEATAMHYAWMANAEDEGILLTIDFGARTTEVSITDIGQGIVDVLASGFTRAFPGSWTRDKKLPESGISAVDKLVLRLLTVTGLSMRGVTTVILTGGNASAPGLQSRMDSLLKRKTLLWEHGMTSAAEGASIQAGKLFGQINSDQMLLLDTYPENLGVIDRNRNVMQTIDNISNIPTKKREEIEVKPGEKNYEFWLTSGFSERPEENLPIKHVSLPEASLRRNGYRFASLIEIDTNGKVTWSIKKPSGK